MFSFDPIPRSAGLDQKPLPFGIEIENRLMAMAPIKNLVLEEQKPFYLAVSLRQIKKFLLCVLGDSAVKFLFGQA
jgi:hypothetical protein